MEVSEIQGARAQENISSAVLKVSSQCLCVLPLTLSDSLFILFTENSLVHALIC
jgi:hypothetical protein